MAEGAPFFPHTTHPDTHDLRVVALATGAGHIDTRTVPHLARDEESLAVHRSNHRTRRSLGLDQSSPEDLEEVDGIDDRSFATSLYLVQVKPPITRDLKEAVREATGLALEAYVPHNAFVVEATEPQAQALAHGCPGCGVMWVGAYEASHKVHDTATDEHARTARDAGHAVSRDLLVSFFTAAGADHAAAAFVADPGIRLTVVGCEIGRGRWCLGLGEGGRWIFV